VRKFFVFLILIPIAILIAGTYGIIHDQITYAISPEYYSKYKFEQFGLLHSTLPDRAKAGIVGFLASWWMGIPIGVIVGGLGFIHRGHWRMFEVTLWSFLLVAGFTLAVGLAGLAYGYYRTASIDLRDYRYWSIPSDVVDLRRFLCVGYVHNSSYVGGAASLIVAGVFHGFVRLRVKMPGRQLNSSGHEAKASKSVSIPVETILIPPILGLGAYLTYYFVIVDLHHSIRIPEIGLNKSAIQIMFLEANRNWTAYPDYHGLPDWLFAPVHKFDRTQLRPQRWAGTRSHTEELSFSWLLGVSGPAWDPMTEY
jgi:hypothetical protein